MTNKLVTHRDINGILRWSDNNCDVVTGIGSDGSKSSLQASAPNAAKNRAIDFQRIAVTAGRCLAHLDRQCWPDLFASYDTFHEALGLPMSWKGSQAPTQGVNLSGDLGRVLASLDSPDFLSALVYADRTIRTMRHRCLNECVQEFDRQQRLVGIVGSTLDEQGWHDSIAAERAVLGICPFVTVQGIRYSVQLDTDLNSNDVPVTKVETPAPCTNCNDAEWYYERTMGGRDQIACECGYHLNVEGGY